MHIIKRAVLFSIFILTLNSGLSVLAQPAGEQINAKVVGVHDGDTITALTPMMEEIKVRLGEIDAPELRQPFGQKSKQMLSDMVFGKEVVIIKTDKDRYGRTVGRVYVGEEDINRDMAAQGGAWAYLEYLSDNSILEAQNAAKTSKIGLWALQADQVIPPWEWRHAKKGDDAGMEPTTIVTPAPAAPIQDHGLWEPLPEQYPYPSSESVSDAPPPAQDYSGSASSTATSLTSPTSPTCTKHCNKGKPCGDSCIPQNKSCTKPPGKAC